MPYNPETPSNRSLGTRNKEKNRGHLGGSDSRDANRAAVSSFVNVARNRFRITQINQAHLSAMSSSLSVTLVPSCWRMTIMPPTGAIRPVNCCPFVVTTVVERYWSLITFDGYSSDSSTSARLKRFETVVRSGPMPSPSLPYLWHLRPCPFSKTTLPRAASPFWPAGSFSRKASRSSNLYFDSGGLSSKAMGKAGSFGKVWTNHRAHDASSFFQSPSSAPKR